GRVELVRGVVDVPRVAVAPAAAEPGRVVGYAVVRILADPGERLRLHLALDDLRLVEGDAGKVAVLDDPAVAPPVGVDVEVELGPDGRERSEGRLDDLLAGAVAHPGSQVDEPLRRTAQPAG